MAPRVPRAPWSARTTATWLVTCVAFASPALALAQDTGGMSAPPLELLPAEGADDRQPAHLGRALLETLAVQTGGTVWYWQDLEFNSPDWDLRWDWPSWRWKLLSLDAVRFDQNQFGTNAGWHPTWGTVSYHIGRGNGL